jgi:hypothetical protein
LQLTSISGGRLLHPQPEDAPCHGDKGHLTWESQKERDHYDDQDIGGWTVLKWILKRGWDGKDWIDLAQDRDNWRALVNTVMNLRVP